MGAGNSSVERLKKADESIDALLVQMTLEEKHAMVSGNTMFTSMGVPRLGIADMMMSDGPHGVREEVNTTNWAPAGRDDDFATYLPTGTALAASWNPAMAELSGRVLGAESRARGKDIILGPGINVLRTPLCGRNFEYYSEDPYLISALVVPVIKAIQKEDTAACVKHFAVNNQELDRFEVDTIVDERTLREIYLPGFEAAIIKGGCLTLMGGYNKFRGQYCCHNQYLINEILKKEWGFKGVVVSDWNGTHDTTEAVEDGLDIEMGTRREGKLDYYLGDNYLKGLQEGLYTQEMLDDKVRRILRVMLGIGKLDTDRRLGACNTAEHHQAARTIAEETMVLLKNEDDLLPFDRHDIKTLAVIGDNASRPQAYGGGSSAIKSSYEITPLEGLRNLLGDDVEIIYEQGYPESCDSFEHIAAEYLGVADEGSGARGWKTRYFEYPNEAMHLVQEQVALTIENTWDTMSNLPETPNSFFMVQWTAQIVPPVSGVYHLVVQSNQRFRICVDGACLCDMNELIGDEARSIAVTLKAGKLVEVMIENVKIGSGKFIKAGWVMPGSLGADEKTREDRALQAAHDADAVVFVGGLNHRFDTEGRDREDMQLPDGQNELLSKILAVNPQTVVALVGGAPVEMPWVDHAPAVIQAWYAGMESGTVLADILFGVVNPSGKLPCTFPKCLADTPVAQKGEYQTGSVTYHEGLLVGYRWYDTKNIEPLFPFGHGLSYTSFEYSDLIVTQGGAEGVVATVTCTVENTGLVAGAEVVQLYIGDPECSVERPAKELKGFRKVMLNEGESHTITLALTKRDLSFYDTDAAAWRAEPGTFDVMIGSSSRDIWLIETFEYSE